MCLDCFYLLCWIQGILGIAYAENRQRIGDRFVDTIVVSARSSNLDNVLLTQTLIYGRSSSNRE